MVNQYSFFLDRISVSSSDRMALDQGRRSFWRRTTRICEKRSCRTTTPWPGPPCAARDTADAPRVSLNRSSMMMSSSRLLLMAVIHKRNVLIISARSCVVWTLLVARLQVRLMCGLELSLTLALAAWLTAMA